LTVFSYDDDIDLLCTSNNLQTDGNTVDSLNTAFNAASTLSLSVSMFIAVTCSDDTRKLRAIERELHEAETVDLNYLIGFTAASDANTFADAVNDETQWPVMQSTFVQSASAWGVNITTVTFSTVEVTDNSVIPTSDTLGRSFWAAAVTVLLLSSTRNCWVM